MKKTRARRSLVLLAVAAAAGTAFAQKPVAAPAGPAWPTQPVKILVGFPGGSTPDLVARTIAEPLAKALGQPVVVENRPGAGGNIAAAVVAKATDNHTIGVLINGNMTIARILNPATPFDPVKDLQPVSLIGTAPLLLAAPAEAPGKDAQEFFLAARNAGDKWSYGTPGIGTVGHIGMELLKTKTNISAVHVPYPGNPQVVKALVTDEVQLSLLPPGLAAPQIRAGKLKAIAVTGKARLASMPDVPTFAEAGLPDYDFQLWFGVLAPAGTPKDIVDKLATEITRILALPDVKENLTAQAIDPQSMGPAQFGAMIKNDIERYGKVIKAAGIKIE